MFDMGVAVVGAGFIGPVHMEALRRLGLKIQGILGCNDAESTSARATYMLPKAYKDIDEVLADPKVQTVHLCVPNVLHYEFAKRAVKAGKHVMCEKPLAMNSAQSAELVELARANKVAAGVCYNLRFYPLNLQVRDMIQRKELGEIYLVNGNYVQDWLLYDTDYNWRVLADQGGDLRAVADIGTHWIDLVLSMTGLQVEQIFADMRTIHETRKRPTGEVQTFTGKLAGPRPTEPVKVTTEDYASILFRFHGGARGSLYVSQVTAGRKNCLRYEISASKSSVAWNSENPEDLWIGHREKANEWLLRDPSLLSDMPRGYTNYPGGHHEGFPDTFKQCFRAFYSYIAKGDFKAPPMFPTFEQGHKEVVLCENILKSHRQQQWVTL